MEGQPVSGCSSEYEGCGEYPAPRFAYTEQFYEAFPYYLAMGMTYELFWEQDCELVKYYRKADKLRQERENRKAWLQGGYFYEAMVDVAPVLHAFAKKGAKPEPYRNTPFQMVENRKEKRDAEQKSDARAKAYMETFALSFNRNFQKKGGEMNAGKSRVAGS